MSKILDAVSVVLVCGKQVFAIQRQNFLKSFPGYWAFPGGKVEVGEKLWDTVVREAQEELGINLSEMNLLSVEELGVAITPDFNPYRFATYFYKITLPSKPEMQIDRGEAFIADWFDPKELVSKYEMGEMLVVPPVLKVFRSLSEDIGLTKVDELNVRIYGEGEVPAIETIHGVKQFMPLSHTLPPANRTNCFLIGDLDSIGVLVDPSPKDQDEFNKLCYSLRAKKIDLIMLTHHHGDHHQLSPELARHLKVSIALSEDTKRRITQIRPDYFDGIELKILKDGEVLTRWLGHEVSVVAVPGHDEGQIALMPRNGAWFIAGDLFQGIGTVVIGGDEGDMTKYMHTLEKVIALKPRAVYPSHGIALGGTNILEKTLEHRKLREEQVLELKKLGKSDDEILDTLYSEIPEGLRKYAMKNIHSHIRKLQVENKI